LRRRRAAALALALTLPALALTTSTAQPPSTSWEPVDPGRFTLVQPDPTIGNLEVELPAAEPPATILDFPAVVRSFPPRPDPSVANDAGSVLIATPTPAPTPRPTAAQTPAPARVAAPTPARVAAPTPTPARVAAPTPTPAPTRAPAPAPTPTPAPVVAGGGSSVSGTASWYCLTGRSICTRGYPGGLYAAAGPALRVGDWRGRTVTVCGNGTCIPVTLIDWCQCYGTRVIDLYSDAFSRLAPLSSGVVNVTVRW
jgi:hypothetical protein